MRNLAAALFRLEHSRTPEAVVEVLNALVEWLQAPEQASLRRAFTGSRARFSPPSVTLKPESCPAAIDKLLLTSDTHSVHHLSPGLILEQNYRNPNP